MYRNKLVSQQTQGFLLITFLLFGFVSPASAITNTQSIDLESSSSQYLSISDANQTGLDITGDITVEAWIKLEQLPSVAGDEMLILGKTDTSNRSYELFISLNNKLAFQFTDGSNWTAVEGASATFTSGDVGKWIHVAASADVSAAASGINLYRDGESLSKNTQANNATAIVNSAANFQIGKGSTYHGNFDGLIDEPRIWDDIRTQSEIENNLYVTLSGSESNLASYWELDATSTDKTVNTNDLMLNGAPSYSENTTYQIECSIPAATFKTLNYLIDVTCDLTSWL